MPSRWSTFRRLPALATGLLAVSLLLPSGAVSAPRGVAGYRYVSPLPGARLVSPWNNIVLRQGGIVEGVPDAGALSVTGAVSGHHDGTLIVSDDGKTLVFTPREPFALGEMVSVRLLPGIATREGPLPPLGFEFTVADADPKAQAGMALESFLADLPQHASAPAPAAESVSAPRAAVSAQDTMPPGYPDIALMKRDNPEPGGVFIAPFTRTFGDDRGRLIVLDNFAQPLFYRSTPRFAWDFKRQPDGRFTYFTYPPAYMVLETNGALVDAITTGNGYVTDGHDIQLLPNGHALLMAYDWQPVDMSTVIPGGDPDAMVGGLIVQELDAAKNVVFQWRSWDHIPITDMVPCGGSLYRPQVDYVHGNAVELDHDGNILISSRHLSEITKIDRDTGDIIWRLGLNANQNQFTFVNDTRGFSLQHDIRRLPNGNISLFDNGNCLWPLYSRGIEYALDEVNMTATQVWEYRNTPDTYGSFMGNLQRREGAGTMVGWGGSTPDPKLTDLNADGSEGLEIGFLSSSMWSYRAFRFPWENKDFSVSPTELHFGSLQEGEAKEKSLSVTNTGSADVEINGFAATFDAYSILDPLPVTIPPGGSVDLRVQFMPPGGGDFDGTIYVRAVNDTQLVAAPVTVFGNSLGEPLAVGEGAIAGYALHAGLPNPFRDETTIRFDLPRPGRVTLEVFDVRGRRVETLVDGARAAGRHVATWRSDGRPNGIYFYRLEAGDFTATRGVTLIR